VDVNDPAAVGSTAGLLWTPLHEAVAGNQVCHSLLLEIVFSF
jgi:hypothetical protein